MKNIFLISIAITLLASCATQPKTVLEKVKEVPVKEATDDWYLFENEEQDYSIRFPNAPMLEEHVVNSDLGELNMKIFMSDEAKEEVTYMTTATDYPMGIVHSSKTETFNKVFRGAIDGAVSNVDGKLLSETKINLDEFEGRLAKIDVKNGLGLITMKLYLIGSRLYMLQTIHEVNQGKPLYINRFFDSFKVSEAFKTAARQGVATSETTSGWQLYESKVGAYKITFPKAPIESSNVIDVETGKLNLHAATCDADADNLMYMSAYIDYPDSLFHIESADLNSFYESAINGAVTNVNGKLVYAKDIQLNNMEGREAKINYEVEGESGITMLRVFLAANRMYMIQTITENGKDANASIGRFMDSFELIE